VTLASLTAGYFVGGWAADRRPRLDGFALETIGGGAALLLTAWLRKPVLALTTPLGVKAGSLVSAAVLFTPALLLLAMTGPLAIRLVTGDFTLLGRGVGKVYGVSTLGSMLGAILTGFVLIPNLSVTSVILATAVVLLAFGALGLLLSRRTVAAALCLGAGLLAAVASGRSGPRAANVVYLGRSFHGEIKVLDAKDARVLLIDGVDNGFVDRRTMESLAPYIASFEYLPAARPAAKRALCIGLGAGSVPRSLRQRHAIATEVVEIDPEIVRVARRYFGFPPDIPVVVEDGRTFVEHAPHRYDFVVLDAFHAEAHALHLFTREFFARVDAILEPGGIIAINMVGIARGPLAAAGRRPSDVASDSPPSASSPAPQRDAFTNIFVVASHEPLPAPATLGGRRLRDARGVGASSGERRPRMGPHGRLQPARRPPARAPRRVARGHDPQGAERSALRRWTVETTRGRAPSRAHPLESQRSETATSGPSVPSSRSASAATGPRS
jgi:spermidine synthase